MANSTDTQWDINGVSLQTYAWNIETKGGDLQAPPPLRGENQKIPYRPGEVLLERIPDAMTRTFRMFVIGTDEDGNVPRNPGARARFDKNLRDLRNLFWNQGRPVQITKRWRDYDTGQVKSATGTAIFEDGFAPAMQGAARGTFNVSMHFADPFFYGAQESFNFPATATSTVTPTILGEYPTTDIEVDFSGVRNNWRLTNLTENIWVNIQSELTSGQLARLDVDEWTAIKTPTSPVNLVRWVTSFGHKYWFALRPGAQQLRLSSASGAGGATLKYRPRWL